MGGGRLEDLVECGLDALEGKPVTLVFAFLEMEYDLRTAQQTELIASRALDGSGILLQGMGARTEVLNAFIQARNIQLYCLTLLLEPLQAADTTRRK